MRIRPVLGALSRGFSAACLTALALLAGCDAGNGDTTSPTVGRVSVLLTDAPGDFKHAVVTISRVYLQGGNEDDETGERVVLSSDEVTTDLLTLTNDVRTLVDNVVIPAGSYGQLRFVISGAYIEVENPDGSTSIYATSPDYDGLPDGATVDGELQMPSAAHSGLKVALPPGTEIRGDAQTLLVDFDVAQSFGHQAGKSGRWVMHPVLRATSVSYTGSVLVKVQRGANVTLPNINNQPVTLANFAAKLTNAAGSAETVALTDANNDGVFEAQFRFLIPGAYTVDLTGPVGLTFATTPTRPASVDVGSAQNVEVAFTITSATTP